MSQITNLKELYTALQDDAIGYGEGRTKAEKKICAAYVQNEMKKKRYEGRMATLKRLLMECYPVKWLRMVRRVRKVVTFRTEDYRRKLSRLAVQDIVHNIDKYEKTWKLFDDTSRQVYLAMLMYRITGNYKFSIRVKSHNRQYFSDKIAWKQDMTIADCGAYIGDTLRAFMEEKISVKNYYMYELNDDNYAKQQAICTMAEERGINVYRRKKGVYAQSTTLYFEPDKGSSRVVDHPTQASAEVVSLDEDIKADNVDFIKMDVEGSELAALDGAVKIIKRDKPVLAICIYHKQEDFWQLPLRIKEICPEYTKFWIEQYTVWDTETVLFVAP